MLGTLPVAAWTYLAAGRGRFWSTGVRLGEQPAPPRWPAVTIVVPARDEAAVLGETLPSLLGQDYPGPASIVLVDDGSADATAVVARRAVAEAGRDGVPLPLTVLAGAARPEGWAGKLWAVHQGVAHATGGIFPPEWLLLTDADIAHPPDSLRRLVAAAIAGERDAVSLMARLRVGTRWERLVVPAFVYFFSLLYPFRWVATGRTAAAAGGCLLVRRAALERAGGVAAVRGAVIDDVALAGRLRSSGASLWLGLGDDVRSVRTYPRLGDLWAMVSRSAYTQLRYSPPLLAATLAGLGALYVGPVAATVAGTVRRRPQLLAAGASAWSLMALTYLPMVRHHGLPRRWALTLPASAALYGAMTVDSARRHRRGGVEWKGRRYGLDR